MAAGEEFLGAVTVGFAAAVGSGGETTEEEEAGSSSDCGDTFDVPLAFFSEGGGSGVFGGGDFVLLGDGG